MMWQTYEERLMADTYIKRLKTKAYDEIASYVLRS